MKTKISCQASWSCLSSASISKENRHCERPAGHLGKHQITCCGKHRSWTTEGPSSIKKPRRSCRIFHGLKHNPTYVIWKGMRSRCNNTNGPFYLQYGGRGISMCERWDNFLNFLQDMGECPSGMSIDRINNDGNYEPGNCRWATLVEQANNKSSNVRIEINGETRTLAQWAVISGISRKTIYFRLRSGWEPQKAVMEPLIQYPGRKTPKD